MSACSRPGRRNSVNKCRGSVRSKNFVPNNESFILLGGQVNRLLWRTKREQNINGAGDERCHNIMNTSSRD